MITQQQKVLAYMKSGRAISAVKAQVEFGVLRLAAVVHELRKQGHNIESYVKRTFNNTNYTEYRLQ